jgi:NAD-dependent deacetylase
MSQIQNAAYIISSSQRIAILSGAGISTSAGIPDFRGPNGLYSRKDIPAELLFDIGYFRKDPSLFYHHIYPLWKSFRSADPTKAHYYLADLEKKGKIAGIITQNIDALHEKAGSVSVIPIHGDFDTFICISCGERSTAIDMIFNKVENGEIPKCLRCGNTIKPSVVFFGEAVNGFDKAEAVIRSADCIIIIGSSLNVYPAATLPKVRSAGSKLIIINKGETYLDGNADCVIDDDIDTAVESIKNYEHFE